MGLSFQMHKNCKTGYTFETNQNLEDFKPTILVVCRQDANGNPTWVAESLNFSRSMTPAPRKTGLISNMGAAISLRCEKIRCDPPKNIDIVSCLRNTTNQLNCKLQCKDGFVPSARLYDTNSSFVELTRIQHSLPKFSESCKRTAERQETFLWEHDISNSTSPGHLSCMDEDSLAQVCLADDIYSGPSSHFIRTDENGEPTFKDEKPNCPYQLEQLFEFYDEEKEGKPVLSITKYRWEENCLINLESHLRTNYIGQANESNDMNKVEYVTPQIYTESGKDCKSTPNAEPRIQCGYGGVVCKPVVFNPCWSSCGKCGDYPSKYTSFNLSGLYRKLYCLTCKKKNFCKFNVPIG